MAKIAVQVDLTDELKKRLDSELQHDGVTVDQYISDMMQRHLSLNQKSDSKENPNHLPHDEWLRQLKAWQAELPIPPGRMTDEDMRRINLYDDERG